MSQNKKEEMREGKTTRQCDIVVKQTLQDAENKNPTMHITCRNKGEQKLYKLQRKKLLKKFA
jgi:5,10-methylenetetrahydrofolate reductase